MQLGERCWTEVTEWTKRVIVVPIGAFEQHGHHLPLLTDSLIGQEIARRAEAELQEEAVFLPLLWLGASEHHRGFPGTLSLSNDTYVRVLNDLLESLIGAGFRRILLLNSHGGNITPGYTALYNVHLRHHQALPDLWLTLATWFQIAQEQCAAVPNLKQAHVIHACEWETAMMQVIRPDLVKEISEDRAGGTHPAFSSAFYTPDFSRINRVEVARAFDDITATGALGYPELATPEKGEALITAAVGEVVTFVREFATWPDRT